MTNRNTLYIYNICYKLPIKICKDELTKIITRHSRYEKIKMQQKMPGQAFIRFKNIASANRCLKVLDGYFFVDRKLKCRFADKDMILEFVSLSLYVINVLEDKYDMFDQFFNGFSGIKNIRFIKTKNVMFIDFEKLQNSKTAKIAFEKKFRGHKIFYSKG